MSTIDVVLFDLGNTLFYDNAARWPAIYRRAEAALWRALNRSGVGGSGRELYPGSPTFLEHYYGVRGSGLDEPGAFRVLANLLQSKGLAVPDVIARNALGAMYAVTQANWRVERDAGSTLQRLCKAGYRLGAVSNGSDHQNAVDIKAGYQRSRRKE